MVLTNLIMAIHGNMTANRPLIGLMATRGCRNADAIYSIGGY